MAVVSVGALNSNAQITVWGGVPNADWSVGTNWSNGSPVPGGTADFGFNATSTVDANFTFANLNTSAGATLNNSGVVTLTITGTFNESSGAGRTVLFNNVGIAGGGVVDVTGVGTLNLTGTGLNTYTGATTITNGTFADGAANSFSSSSDLLLASPGIIQVNFNETVAGLSDTGGGLGSVVITNGGTTLILAGGISSTFSGVISGLGGLEKTVTGTLILTGANTYTGPTVINGVGTTAIQIGSGVATGSIASNSVSGTGTLSFDLSSAYNYAGTLSGALAVVQSGTGTTTLSGPNTYTGSTSVTAGTLQAGSAIAFGNMSAVTISGSGTLDLNNFNDTIGSLTNANALSSITLGSGTLTVGSLNATSTFAGVISGTGGLTYNTFGETIVLTGANTYTGTTTIDQGTVQIGNLGITGSIGNGPIVTFVNGQITFARTDANTYSNLISGGGGVEDAHGTVTLTGANTYSGTTNVVQGTLNVGSPTALGNGFGLVDLNLGTLNLNNFNIQIGSLIADASSAVNLGTGNLTLHSIAANTTFAGTMSGTGALTVFTSNYDVTSSTNTYSGGTTITLGALIADNANPLSSATGSGPVTIFPGGATLAIGNDSPTGYITNLPIVDNGILLFQRTDVTAFPNSVSGTGSVEAQDGGTVTLNGANTYSGGTDAINATLIAGSAAAFGNGSSLLFLNFGGIVNLNNFNASFGSVQGGAGTSIKLGTGTLTTGNTGGPNIYGGVISGTGGLDVAAPGDAILTGTNTYTGPTVVAAGADLTLGFGGATGTIASNSVSGAGTLLFDFNNANTIAAALSGALNLRQVGTGTTTLSAGNTYSGSTTITRGQLWAGSANAFGGAGGLSAVDITTSGILSLNGFPNTVGSITGDATSSIILPGANILTTGGSNTSTNFMGVISGTGSLAFAGTGTLTLDGVNIFTGSTNIGAGTVQVGDGSTPGASIVGNVLDNSHLVFEPAASDNIIYAGQLTGTGDVTFSGTGKITLSSNFNIYSGDTFLDSGTLADAALDSYSANSGMVVNAGGTLKVNFNEVVGDLEDGGAGGSVVLAPGTILESRGIHAPVFTGTISGAGAISIFSGNQGFNGQSTYTGGTTVTGGELYFQSSTIGPPGAIVSGPIGTGLLTLDAGTTISPTVSNVILANAINLSTFGAIGFEDLASVLNLDSDGNIIGTGGIQWHGHGVLTLAGNNSFAAGVDLVSGTLLVGSNTAAGTGLLLLGNSITLADAGVGSSFTIPNPIVLGGAVQIGLGAGDNNSLTLTGPMTGAGAVTYAAGPNGTLTLDADNSGAAVTFTLTGGTAFAGNNNSFGGPGRLLTLTGGATVNVMNGIIVNNPISTSGVANVLAGNGSIGTPITVDGTLVLSPSASPGGGPGTLDFDSPLTLASGGTINFHLFDANGMPGTGYSSFVSLFGLNVTAAANTLAFNVITIDGSGNLMPAVNFNNANSYSWQFCLSPSGIIGFNSNQFNINTALFANATGGGTFSVSEVGNDLFLNFTPVPEPSTWALIAAGIFTLVPFALRRRRVQRA